jgi:DNA-binding response OmpR family regulator
MGVTDAPGSSSVDVLSVEDDGKIARLIQVALEAEGYSVKLCEDGLEALRCLEDEEPDVILLDLMLPRMDGREFVWELRRTGRNTPVILVSAARDLPRRAAELPVQGYVAKPFAIPELVATIDSVVASP